MSQLHGNVWRWLRTCPYARDLLFLYGHVRDDSVTFVPAPGAEDVEIARYISGATERRYTFSLLCWQPLGDGPCGEGRLRSLRAAEKVAEWVLQQRDAGSFPTLPRGCVPIDMRPVPAEEHSVTMADGELMRCLFRFTIDYLQTA